MAKKRKTRQEKVIADLRRQLKTHVVPETSAAPSSVSTYSLPTIKTTSLPASSQPPATSSYRYVLSDLKKTFILTSIAIASQIALYVILPK